MSDIFNDDEDDLIENDEFVNSDDIEVKAPLKNESTILDARRRLENLLEEKRLREELGDFDDFDD